MNDIKNRGNYIFLSFVILILSCIIAEIYSDIAQDIKAIGVFVSCIIIWISKSLPISISSLFFIAILPLLNLMSPNEIFDNFGTSTMLFIIASSSISTIISKSSIPSIITQKLLNKMRLKPCKLLIMLSLIISFFSAFMSSLATCTLFVSIFVPILKKYNLKENYPNFVKSVMILIPACSGIGGFITPAGTPANILVLEVLNKYNYNVTFIKWSLIGIPIGIIATLIFDLSLVYFLKPEKIYREFKEEKKKMDTRDVSTTAIIVIIIIGWVLSSFIPIINITIVAIFGMFLMFIPPFNILNMHSFSKGVNIDLAISMGSVSVIMTAIANTNVFTKITNAVLVNTPTLNSFVVIIIFSFLVCILRAFIPTTTAVIALFTPIAISISETSKIDICCLLFIIAFWAASALLLVFTEPIYLISYKEKCFEEIDLLKVGTLPCILLTFLSSIGIYFLTKLII